MSTRQLFTNNAVSLLMAPIGPSDTTFSVLPGDGALFPQPAPDGTEYFNVTLEDQSASTREIIKVFGRVGDTFTNIQRAQEGTVAQAWPAGGAAETLVDHRVTAETIRRLQHETNFGQPTQGTVEVIVGNTEEANTLPTTGPNKTCKWIVTIQTADNRICMVEILAVYKAPPQTPIFGQYAKVGDKIKFKVHVVSTASNMTLEIENTDTSLFTSVDVIRLQHYQ